MSRLGTLVVVGALVAPLTGVLAAAMPGDYLPPPIEGVVPKFFDLSSWYLRADVGYAWGRLYGAEATSGYPGPATDNHGDGFIGGIGGGIKTGWLRTDVTIEYTAPLKYTGAAATSDDATARISGRSALFKRDIDPLKRYDVSPYIGAGYMPASDYSSAVAPPFSGGDDSQWNFSKAGMAGLGYAITSGLMLDVGYRATSFGNVESRNAPFAEMTFRKVAAHEVQVGVRWIFDHASLPN